MLFELTYRVNSGKLSQTNNRTNKLVTQTGCFRKVILFFSDVLRTRKKQKKTPNGRHSEHEVF